MFWATTPITLAELAASGGPKHLEETRVEKATPKGEESTTELMGTVPFYKSLIGSKSS